MTSLQLLRQNAFPVDSLSADASWLEDALAPLGSSRFALLGEASHGTHDFYRMRAEITKRLIEKKGFKAVAVEADWPDAYRINRYVRGIGADLDAEGSLGGFLRFPTWMWRNADVLDFIGWLREYNDSLPAGEPKVGFYGLDLYSLRASMEAVVDYLRKTDPEAAERARRRYACFDRFGGNAQSYSYFAGSGLSENCEKAVVAQMKEIQSQGMETLQRDGLAAEDELFFAQQNARVVRNAEAYYRTMLGGNVSSWNLRDQHMAETLELLVEHLARRIDEPKVALWAHNSHLGDARFTQMSAAGEWNVGQLVRRQHREQAFLLGFTTYEGTVTAASDWDSPAERKRVRPALPNSYEQLFHQTGIPRFILNFRSDDFLRHAVKERRLERAIGVIYSPETERASHYFYAQIGDQFDAIFHLDHTRAVEPLERTARWEQGEAPETYPSAL